VIRAVVFDVGGVLCPNPLGEFAKVDEEYGLPAGTVMSHVRGGDEFARCEIGELAIAEFFDVARIADEHAIKVPAQRLDAMMLALMGGDAVRPTMRDLVIEIKAAGYRTALLTNIFAERREWLHAIFPAGTIDVFGDSSALGLRKPEQPIYDKLVELLGCRPEEIAFVDDFPENLVPARAMGIVDIQYESPEQVRRVLIEAGVQIQPRHAEVA
jgi:epoxide hydrolase-like predicted phosphatase